MAKEYILKIPENLNKKLAFAAAKFFDLDNKVVEIVLVQEIPHLAGYAVPKGWLEEFERGPKSFEEYMFLNYSDRRADEDYEKVTSYRFEDMKMLYEWAKTQADST